MTSLDSYCNCFLLHNCISFNLLSILHSHCYVAVTCVGEEMIQYYYKQLNTYQIDQDICDKRENTITILIGYCIHYYI